MSSPPIERALISVSDKTGLIEFAQKLAAADIEIFSTGGTASHLREAQIQVTDISQYTRFPEMMDGRLKTLHPKIHGGILCRRDQAADMDAASEHGILPFDLVVVNLYPFVQTIARPGVTVDEAIEQIDIGGPTMVRAAAKNHAFVTLATDPGQYESIAEQIRAQGCTSFSLRRQLAAAAFALTAAYDTSISAYFAHLPELTELPAGAKMAAGMGEPASHSFQPAETLQFERKMTLRYGENPHQAAALYVSPLPVPDGADSHTLAHAQQLHGKELSYNNLLDLDAALAAARSLPQPGVVVLKHNNPCGAATAGTLAEAGRKAWAGDPLSAFGSVLGVNVPVDGPLAQFLAEPGKFVEAIVAPDFDAESIEILTTKPKWKKNVRLLRVGDVKPGRGKHQWRQIDGGMLCQQADDLADDPSSWKVVTQTPVTPALQADLAVAWSICRHVKSNAIVLVQDGALVGVGAGQMSRVDSVEIAIRKSQDRCRGAVLASDAFFPFADSIEQAAAAGVAAVIQPGGSRRDEEVIAACNEHGLPMIFTGCRHFRH